MAEPVNQTYTLQYIEYGADAGGRLGCHLVLMPDGRKAVYIRVHSTPLRKFNAHGIRADLLAFCHKEGIEEVHFENLLDDSFRIASVDSIERGVLADFGGKGMKWYLPLHLWRDGKRDYSVDFTPTVVDIRKQERHAAQ